MVQQQSPRPLTLEEKLFPHNPSWGRLGKPPQEVLDAHLGMGKRWSELAKRLKKALKLPKGKKRNNELQSIDWMRQSIFRSVKMEAQERQESFEKIDKELGITEE